MKLNKECIRDMLLYIEEHCIYYDDAKFGHRLHEVTWLELSQSTELSQYTLDDKYYTVQKLFEGRFIQGTVVPKNCYHRFTRAYINSLTLSGHKLLDNIRPEPVWNKTKGILHKIGDFSIDVMSQVAGEVMAAYTKSMMNLN